MEFCHMEREPSGCTVYNKEMAAFNTPQPLYIDSTVEPLIPIPAEAMGDNLRLSY